MPHISDGEINAWLDGAMPEASAQRESIQLHLEVCPDCRARLEQARQIRNEAGEILAGAQPAARERPAFEELVRRAQEPSHRASSSLTVTGRPQSRWRSVERLAWAASVLLAVGAGWIGREVLTERGWTDPFHTAATDSVAEVVDAPTSAPLEDSESSFADAAGAREQSSVGGVESDEAKTDEGSVGRSVDVGAAAPVAAPKDDLSARKSVADPHLRQEVAAEEAAPEKEGERVQGAVAETEQLDEAIDPNAAAGRERRADGVSGPPEEADRFYAEPDLEAQLLGADAGEMHAAPASPRAYRAGDPDGCYAIEQAFADGALVPPAIELRPVTVEDGQEAIHGLYSVGLPSGFEEVDRSRWIAFDGDSVWVQLSTGSSRITFRLIRVDTDFSGMGFVRLDAEQPARNGPVQLRPVPCVELE